MRRKHMTKRFLSMLLVWVMVMSLVPSVPADAAKKAKVSKVTVASSLSGSKKTVVIAKGKKVKLSTVVSVKPNKKANKGVTYKSANTKIATVDSKGNVKGVSVGSTKITVTSKKDTKKNATITAKVVSKAVKKVTLNSKSGAMFTGDTLTLKAKVKAKKGAVKTVGWKSSNTKVATVNSKGKITAVGAGSATITAQAIDGSGKKAKYQLTVQDPVYMTGMSVINAQSVTFSLNTAYPLDASAVSVMTKKYTQGQYQGQLKINNMTTADSVNYTIVLDNDSRLDLNEYVQVSIPSLNGAVKSMEAVYSEPALAYTGDEIISMWVGRKQERSLSFSDGAGYSSYAINALPAGLTAESVNDELVIKGVPTTPGLTEAVMTATDEMGNTLTKNVKFIVGSDTMVVAAANTQYDLRVGEVASSSFSVLAVGGSGYYYYTVVSDPSGICNGTSNSTGVQRSYRSFEYKVAIPGQYSLTIRVQDQENAAYVCDVPVTINIAQGITVGGCIRDAQGMPMSGSTNTSVYLTNKNYADRYYYSNTDDVDSNYSYYNHYSQYSWVWVHDDGTYSAIVSPGTYDVQVTHERYTNYGSDIEVETKYLYNQSFATSSTGFDIQLNLYRVVITGLPTYTTYYLNDDNDGYVSTDENGSMVFFAKPGTSYQIATEKDSEYDDWKTVKETNGKVYKCYYKYTATVPAVNGAVQLQATESLVKKVEVSSY